MTVPLSALARAASTASFRLAAAAVAAFLAAGAIITALLFWQTNSILTDQIIASLRAEAEVFAQDVKRGSLEALGAKITALSDNGGPALYYLADGHGRRIAGNLSRVPIELDVNPGGAAFKYARPGEREAARLAVAIPVPTQSAVRLIIGRDIDEQRRYADKMRWTFLLGFGGLAIAGLAFGLVVSRYVLRRIETITATSQSIMAGNLSQRIPSDGSGSELDGLALSLNEMLERIESLMRGLREVSDNIAHDLKTPLNRLRNAAEAALRDERGTEGYREGLEQIIEKADDLIKTFNALLLVARLEAGPLEDNVEEFDLSDLVGDVGELYQPAAEEAGFTLAVVADEPVRVRGNRHLISQALANIIDNAIKYSIADDAPITPGAIAVELRHTEHGIDIAVGDRGAGIAEADRERALKRFVRLEKSRTKPGTGLGLSLVAAVMRLHRGSVRLEDNAPGLRVVMAFPSTMIVESSSAAAAAQNDRS